MRSRSLGGIVLAFVALAALASHALADTPAPSATPAESAAPQPTVAGAGASAPSASAAVPAHPATGYGYSTKPAAGGATRRPVARTTARPAPAGAIATLPDFEMEADGSSRLCVELNQSVQVEERVAKGQLTYVLKGTHVTMRNNLNPLETVHFNTPAVRARLAPSGGDLLFIIELRTQASASWKITPAKDGTAILMVDFAKGSYLDPATPPPPAPRPSTSAAPRR
ncbi:hypothetical protein BH09MYX1_BH09MYX1_49340 [soil metagenome]